MESIYDELDNFEHIAADDKIRDEVITLRATVKEQEDEINRLKEANRAMSETLETIQTNFNSLLKTARAEMERKNEMINTLNAEKDQLIFRQIGNRNAPLGRRYNRNHQSNSSSETNSEVSKVTKRKIECSRNEKNKKPKLESQSASGDQTNETNILEVIEVDNQCNPKEDMSTNPERTKSRVEDGAKVSAIREVVQRCSSDDYSEHASDLQNQSENISSTMILNTLLKRVEEEKILSQQSSRNVSPGFKDRTNKIFAESSTRDETKIGNKEEYLSDYGEEDLRHHIQSLKSKEYRGSRKEGINEIDKREPKLRDNRKEEDAYQSNRDREDSLNRKLIQYLDRKIESRDNKKEELYQDKRTEEDYRNYKRMHGEQTGYRKTSRETDEHCENSGIENTDHHRFSRSKYRNEAKHKYRRSKSSYDYNRYDKNARPRNLHPSHHDRDSRGRPSRHIRGDHYGYKSRTERILSPSYRSRTSLDRRSSGYDREVSRNSSHDGPRDKHGRENDMKWKEELENERKDSIGEVTKLSSREFSEERCIDPVTESLQVTRTRKNSNINITEPSEIQHHQTVQEKSKEIVHVCSQSSEKSMHILDNILNEETRMCQSPDDGELALKIAQPETYIKLIKETGSLNVFDDPRLFSIKYFNEYNIAKNKIMKSTNEKKLDTDIKIRVKTTDIHLQTVMYSEESQKPEIFKKSTPSEEFDANEVDAQFSDSSRESNDLDDSVYFDSKCEQIKAFSEIKISAASYEEPIDKIDQPVYTSLPQSPGKVETSNYLKEETLKPTLKGFKIPKMSKTRQGIGIENTNIILQKQNIEQTITMSSSETKKYLESYVKKCFPENDCQELSKNQNKSSKGKSEAKVSNLSQYKHKETKIILKTKQKNCMEEEIEKHGNNFDQSEKTTIEDRIELDDSPKEKHKETVKKDLDHTNIILQKRNIEQSITMSSSETKKHLESNVKKCFPENDCQELNKNQNKSSKSKSEAKVSDLTQYKHKETKALLKTKHTNCMEGEIEKYENNLDLSEKIRIEDSMELDDSPKEKHKETVTCLISDSKNKVDEKSAYQKDKSIPSQLDNSHAEDKLLHIAPETVAPKIFSSRETNSLLIPDFLNNEKSIDILNDGPKRQKQLFDNSNQHKTYKSKDDSKIEECMVEKNKKKHTSNQNYTKNHKELEQRKTHTNTSSGKTDTTADQASKDKSLKSVSSSRSSKSELTCEDGKKKQKLSRFSKTDQQLCNPSKDTVHSDHSHADMVEIKETRKEPEICIDSSTCNKKNIPIQRSPCDEKHVHKLSGGPKMPIRTSKTVNKSKKESIDEKMTDLFGENSLITTEDLIGPTTNSKIVDTFEEDFHLFNAFNGCNDLKVYEGLAEDNETKRNFAKVMKKDENKFDDDKTNPKNKDEPVKEDEHKNIHLHEKNKLYNTECELFNDKSEPEKKIKVGNNRTVSPTQKSQEPCNEIANTTLSKDVCTSSNIVPSFSDCKSKEYNNVTLSTPDTQKTEIKFDDYDQVILTDITKKIEKLKNESNTENKCNNTDAVITFETLPILRNDIQEKVTAQEKSKEMLPILENVNSKNDDKAINAKYDTKATKQACIANNACNQTALRAFTKNIESVTPTDSDGECANTDFVTSTPNPKVSPQRNLKRKFSIQSPIKECSIENSPKITSVTLPKETGEGKSQSTLMHDTSQTCVIPPRFIIGRRRRVIVKT